MKLAGAASRRARSKDRVLPSAQKCCHKVHMQGFSGSLSQPRPADCSEGAGRSVLCEVSVNVVKTYVDTSPAYSPSTYYIGEALYEEVAVSNNT
jgi:hypothetical protein